MELSKTIILDPDNIPAFVQAMTREVKKILESEKPKVEHEELLSTKELSRIFGYGEQYFRDKINNEEFGRKDRNGKCSATYTEVEKYLFDSKY